MTKPYRVILDTNIWISYLISSRFVAIDVLLSENRIILTGDQDLLVLGNFEETKIMTFTQFLEDIAS